MSEWIEMRDRLPEVGQQVLLANVNRLKSEDALGCLKDVGVLQQAGGLYWSTHGEMRAMRSEAFTHWMPITEPTSSAKEVAK